MDAARDTSNLEFWAAVSLYNAARYGEARLQAHQRFDYLAAAAALVVGVDPATADDLEMQSRARRVEWILRAEGGSVRRTLASLGIVEHYYLEGDVVRRNEEPV